MNNDRRLIEDFIPIKEISKESAREKSIRKGHISTLHLWWARRPLVAARAAVFASLIPAPESHQKRTALAKMMIDLCKWEASEETIKKARKAILEAQRTRLGLPDNTPLKEVPAPKMADLFSGGGAIPLEGLRLGCETYAIELNPVAHIIELCTLVYPQKYGKKLAEEVEKWGHWVIGKVKEEIGDLYPCIGELGVGNLELGGKENGELQGTTGLAEGDRLGDGSLSSDQEISTGGDIRTNLPNSEGSKLNSSKYSGRMGKGSNQGVYLSSEDSKGVTDGTGNSSDSLSTSQLSGANPTHTTSAGDNQYRQNAQCVNQDITSKTVTETQLSLFPDSQIPNSQLLIPNSPKLTPVAYLWTRTVKCPNPSCGASVPLVRQTWLCKKKKKYVALKVIPNHQTKRVDFEVVEAATAKELGFDPSSGSSRGNSTCHHCGTTIKSKPYVQEEGKTGRIGQQLMAIVCTTEGKKGKTYLSATDYQRYIPDESAILKRLEKLCQEAELTIPDEPVKEWSGVFNAPLYGLDNFGKLFTPRQLLSLMTFVKWVRLAYGEILQDLGVENEELGVKGKDKLSVGNLGEDKNEELDEHGKDKLSIGNLGKESLTVVNSGKNRGSNIKGLGENTLQNTENSSSRY
uniref:DUF1156 domain-containing protein n=1 Tax=Cyanothece sp. BG0011 TaxID=2082950 RepID=UPI0030DA38DB